MSEVPVLLSSGGLYTEGRRLHPPCNAESKDREIPRINLRSMSKRAWLLEVLRHVTILIGSIVAVHIASSTAATPRGRET